MYLYFILGKQVYLQRRAMTKSFLPGYFCTSAGGHVRSGETYIQAARRELREELGISCKMRCAVRFSFNKGNHQRLISIFTATTKKTTTFNDGEVMDGAFYPVSKAQKLISKSRKIHPQLKACFELLKEQKAFG